MGVWGRGMKESERSVNGWNVDKVLMKRSSS